MIGRQWNNFNNNNKFSLLNRPIITLNSNKSNSHSRGNMLIRPIRSMKERHMPREEEEPFKNKTDKLEKIKDNNPNKPCNANNQWNSKEESSTLLVVMDAILNNNHRNVFLSSLMSLFILESGDCLYTEFAGRNYLERKRNALKQQDRQTRDCLLEKKPTQFE